MITAFFFLNNSKQQINIGRNRDLKKKDISIPGAERFYWPRHLEKTLSSPSQRITSEGLYS